MFHNLPDVLKIYQIQFDRSLVNIAFSADSLPFEPINFQFQLSSLESRGKSFLFATQLCSQNEALFDHNWQLLKEDWSGLLSWIKGLCQLSIKSMTRKMSWNLTFGIDVEIIDECLPILFLFFFCLILKKANFFIAKFEKKSFTIFFTFYFWVQKIAREESISPHASRHKPPKVVSVRVLS